VLLNQVAVDDQNFFCCLQALNGLPALEELDLSNNKISKIPDLGRCRKVTYKNTITILFFFALCNNDFPHIRVILHWPRETKYGWTPLI